MKNRERFLNIVTTPIKMSIKSFENKNQDSAKSVANSNVREI